MILSTLSLSPLIRSYSRLTNRGLRRAGNRSLQHQLRCLKGTILHELDDVESSIGAFTEALKDASEELEKCDAWMGLAAGIRVKTDFKAALAYLGSAEPIAVNLNLTERLSRLHHLQGNVYFAVGEIEGCGEEHQPAFDYARRAGSLEDEGRALGGLADAANASGRMRSAYESFRLCVNRGVVNPATTVSLRPLITWSRNGIMLAFAKQQG